MGNNRAVATATGSIVQHTQYYPFGLPFDDAQNRDLQPYTYNGKQNDSRLQLNLMDYMARQNNNTYGRFTSMDPLAEKYYSISPYAYVMNNPLKFIDPDGRATHTDSLGNVIAVYNNNDMSVYKHNLSADTYDGVELLAKNGTKMGSTEFWNEFLPEFSNGGKGFTIQFGESFDGVIENMHELSKGMDLKEIAANSGGGGLFDIKKNYSNQGRLLDGKYASSRSAGNYLAGYNASRGTYFGKGVSFDTFQQLAGALHIEESAGGRLRIGQKIDIVLFGSYIDSKNPNKNSLFVAPIWGETPYQYRMSKMGWNHGK